MALDWNLPYGKGVIEKARVNNIINLVLGGVPIDTKANGLFLRLWGFKYVKIKKPFRDDIVSFSLLPKLVLLKPGMEIEVTFYSLFGTKKFEHKVPSMF